MPEFLPPAIASLWALAKTAKALGGFYLLGGTALALRLRHRLSEDLDFAWPNVRLPRPRLDAFVKMLETEGWSVERDDSAESYDEFLNAGMELHDYQQNFIARKDDDSTKLNFFTPSGPLQRLLPPSESERIILPDVALLFRTKALVTSERSASRDWLDLYLLMTAHGFSIDDYAATYIELGEPRILEVGLQRLASGQPRPDDPGYANLAPDAPDLATITAFFRSEITRWKLSTAEQWLGEGSIPYFT